MHDFEEQFRREDERATKTTLIRPLPEIMADICENHDDMSELAIDLGKWMDMADGDDAAVFTMDGMQKIKDALLCVVESVARWQKIEQDIKKITGID